MIALAIWAVFGPVFGYVAGAMAAILLALMVLDVLVNAFSGETPRPP